MEAPDTSTYSKRASKRFRCGAAASPVPPFITSVPPLASFPRGGITVSSGEDALSRRTCFRTLVKVGVLYGITQVVCLVPFETRVRFVFIN